jgi:hypothetical protein
VPGIRALLCKSSLGLKLQGRIRDALISRVLSFDQVFGCTVLEQASRFEADRACVRDEFLCSRSWHAWRHPRRRFDFGSFQLASGFSSSDRATVAYGQPTFFCRTLCRSDGVAVATFLALPALGSSISPCPSIRLRPFFGGVDDAFSSAMLRRSASIRFAKHSAAAGRHARAIPAGRPASS